jgi:hypothetical protein
MGPESPPPKNSCVSLPLFACGNAFSSESAFERNDAALSKEDSP